MPSNTPSLQDRIETLEESNRRMKALVLVVPLLVVFMGAEDADTPAAHTTLSTQELVLNDAEGNARAKLHVGDDGPHLIMLDEKGGVRVRLAASEQEGPALWLVDSEGWTRGVFRSPQAESPVISLNNPEGKPFLMLGQNTDNGVGFIQMHDREGEFKTGYGGNAVQ